MLTPTSETSSSEDFFDTKIQSKFDKIDQIFKQPEEDFMDFMEWQYQESKHIEK